MGYKRLTDEQRERIQDNYGRGMGDKVNARMVGVSVRSVRRVLGTFGLRVPEQKVIGVTITNEVEDYRPGNRFSMVRVVAEVHFGNMPNALTMEFSDGHTAEMHGATLVRDDGAVMMVCSPTAHRWV